MSNFWTSMSKNKVLVNKFVMGKSLWRTLYAPPNVNFTDFLCDLETTANNITTPIIICGDINAHHPLWEQNRTTPDRKGQQFLDFTNNQNLIIINDGFPTLPAARLNNRDTGRSVHKSGVLWFQGIRIVFQTERNWLEVYTALKLSGRNKITPPPIMVQGNARALQASSGINRRKWAGAVLYL